MHITLQAVLADVSPFAGSLLSTQDRHTSCGGGATRYLVRSVGRDVRDRRGLLHIPVLLVKI